MFNRTSFFPSFYENKWPSQNFYQMYFGKIRGLGGGAATYRQITQNLVKRTRYSDCRSNEAPSEVYIITLSI